jgi:nitrate reductase NapE component
VTVEGDQPPDSNDGPPKRRNRGSWLSFAFIAGFILVGMLMRADYLGAPVWMALIIAGLLIAWVAWKA